MALLAGEPVEVGLGERSALAQDIAVGVVEVAGNQQVAVVNEAGDVAVAIGVVVGVARRPVSGKQAIVGASQQAADSPGPLKTPAQIPAAGVGYLWLIGGVALLDDQLAVVHVAHDLVGNPGVAAPEVLGPDALSHLAVIGEIAAR